MHHYAGRMSEQSPVNLIHQNPFEGSDGSFAFERCIKFVDAACRICCWRCSQMNTLCGWRSTQLTWPPCLLTLQHIHFPPTRPPLGKQALLRQPLQPLNPQGHFH